jgi:ribose transport system permease protein
METKTELKTPVKTPARIPTFFRSQYFAIVALLVVVFIVFSLGSNFEFLKIVNLRNLLNATVVTAMLTVGAACIMISGQIDFSSGYIGTLGGVMVATFVTTFGWPLTIALPIALVVAAAVGFLNASLVHLLNFQAFIATLATGFICKGLSLVIGEGQTIPYKEPVLTYLGTGRIFDFLPVGVLIAIAVFIIYGILMAKTTFGRSAYLIGGNPNASRLAGLKPRKISYILFINNAVLGAVAGILSVGRLKSASNVGLNYQTFDGILAAILGGIAFGGGSGGLFGAFVGLLIYTSFSNGLTCVGLSAYWSTLAQGLLLLVAVIFDTVLSKRVRRRL